MALARKPLFIAYYYNAWTHLLVPSPTPYDALSPPTWAGTLDFILAYSDELFSLKEFILLDLYRPSGGSKTS
jgi:hypothetical protein